MQPFCQSRFKLKLNYRLLYLTSFLKPFSYKVCHMFRTNCIMHFLRSSSVRVLRYIFRCAHIKLLYIDINGIALYRIAYKENIDISYKLDTTFYIQHAELWKTSADMWSKPKKTSPTDTRWIANLSKSHCMIYFNILLP